MPDAHQFKMNSGELLIVMNHSLVRVKARSVIFNV